MTTMGKLTLTLGIRVSITDEQFKESMNPAIIFHGTHEEQMKMFLYNSLLKAIDENVIDASPLKESAYFKFTRTESRKASVGGLHDETVL